MLRSTLVTAVGRLINLQGEIIGINTAIASNSGGNDGIGFSIPMDMVMRIVTDLIELGKSSAWLPRCLSGLKLYL